MSFTRILHHVEISFWNTVINLANHRYVIRAPLTGFLLVALMVTLVGSVMARAVNPRLFALDQLPLVNLFFHQDQYPGQRQHNTLVVFVDDLKVGEDQETMVVNAVWLVAHLRSEPKLSFVPLFSESELKESLIDHGIQLRQDGSLQGELFDSLRSRGVHWDNFVLLDEHLLNALLRQVAKKGNPYKNNLQAYFKDGDPYSKQVRIFCGYRGDFTQEGYKNFSFKNNDELLYTDLDSTNEDVLEKYFGYYSSFACEFPTIDDLNAVNAFSH